MVTTTFTTFIKIYPFGSKVLQGKIYSFLTSAWFKAPFLICMITLKNNQWNVFFFSSWCWTCITFQNVHYRVQLCYSDLDWEKGTLVLHNEILAFELDCGFRDEKSIGVNKPTPRQTFLFTAFKSKIRLFTCNR